MGLESGQEEEDNDDIGNLCGYKISIQPAIGQWVLFCLQGLDTDIGTEVSIHLLIHARITKLPKFTNRRRCN